jgi:CRP/FNR family cyclic AMP-dependent transcriptional regulator
MADPSPIFGAIDETRARTLFGDFQRRLYPKQSYVINEGDNSDYFYVLLSGKIKIVMTDDSGREVILAILGNGEHFGEFSLIDQQPRSASAVTMEESVLLLVTRDRFRDCLLKNPALAEQFMARLTHRLRAADRKIEGLALHDVYSRIARTLAELATEQDGKLVLPQKLTHQDLAHMVGASREMVTRILRDLTTGGYISIENRAITLLKKLPPAW